MPSYIIDRASEFDVSVLKGKHKVGISSGASVPRLIVDELISLIKSEYPETQVHTFDNPEKNIVFKLPNFAVLQ